MEIKEFNIVIVGVGGQGVLTLLQILDEAALSEGYDFKSAEVHGLSQRGGSIEVHIRFGKNIFSPLVKKGGADLIIALETQEALKGIHFSSKKTIFLINDFLIPIIGQETLKTKPPHLLIGGGGKNIPQILKGISKEVILIKASNICQKEFGTDVIAGVYLLSYGISKNLIPLKSESILKTIKKIIPEKYLELNLKTFEFASDSEAVK